MSKAKQVTPRMEVLGKTLVTTKGYKKEYFKWWYDSESISNILAPANGSWVAQSDVLWSSFLDVQKDGQQNTKNHKKYQWTWAEDEFIRHNYNVLSDNVIGLALNIPSRIVKLRRLVLGLKKATKADTYKVVIWCERNDFAKHVSTYESTGILPSKNRIASV